MRWSYPILNIFGISIELHLTFIAFLILFLFGDFTSFILLSIIFSIVLAHELAHSFMALLHGVKVPKITLLPIGGLATIDLPQDPFLELKVAFSGPLLNFFVAGVCFVALFTVDGGETNLGGLMQNIGAGNMSLDSIPEILTMLISVNLVLGAFNMLPAFPMDGGRVFRGVLALWMDYLTATKIATSVGQLIFMILAFAGIMQGNFWWVLIAIFLSFAGGNELKQVNLRRLLKGIRFRDLDFEKPVYANYELTYSQFMERVYRVGLDIYLLVDEKGNLKKVVDISEIKPIKSDMKLSDLAKSEYEIVDGEKFIGDSMRILFSKKPVFVTEKSRLLGAFKQDALNAYIQGKSP